MIAAVTGVARERLKREPETPRRSQRTARRRLRGVGAADACGCIVQGFARLNVMRTYPDPPFASNAAGRPFSRVGALSQVVSVSPSKAYIPFHSFPFSSPSVCSKSMAAGLALGSGSERNRLIGAGRGDGLPAVDPPHMDLARREQRPEQHRGAFCRGQDGLGFDPALELLVQAFDGTGGARALPLARGQPRECEQVAAGFLQAVGDGAVPKPPFAQEDPPALLDLRGR